MNVKRIFSVLFSKVVKNWPVKILSLGFAIILFVVHHMNTLGERVFLVPLNIECQENLTPSGSFPGIIRINLRGEVNSIFSISEEDIEAYVDMEKYDKAGVHTVPVMLRKKGSALEAGLVQMRVAPMEITVALENKTRGEP